MKNLVLMIRGIFADIACGCGAIFRPLLSFGAGVSRAAFLASCVFLLSCGGGGGAAPDLSASQPPAQSEPANSLTRGDIEEELEYYSESVANPRATEHLSNSEREKLLELMRELQSEIDATRTTLEDLREQWHNLSVALLTLSVSALSPCPTGQERDANSDVCRVPDVADIPESPESPESPDSTEPPESPTVTIADCLPGQVLDIDGATCRSPLDLVDTTPINGQCPEHETLNSAGDRCLCIDGDVRNFGTGKCPPPRPEPPACGANEDRAYRLGDCVCVLGYERDNSGACTKTPQDSIKDALCTPDIIGEDCENLVEEYQRSGTALDKMGALYAYDKGFNGQSVTIVLLGKARSSHEDLDANVLTNSIDSDHIGSRFSNEKYTTVTGTFQARTTVTVTVNGREYTHLSVVAADSATLWNSHIDTRIAAMIIAERNGIGAHGVAPEAKLIPLPRLHRQQRGEHCRFAGPVCSDEASYAVEWIDENRESVHIIVGGTYYDAGDEVADPELEIYRRMADSDLVWVLPASGLDSSYKDNSSITAFATGDADSDDYENWYYREKRMYSIPEMIPELEDNWILARTSLSIKCGVTQNFCLTAPAYGPHIQPEFYGDKDKYRELGGFTDLNSDAYPDNRKAAAYISGALALLQSAAPELPMTVISRILLTTATDVGEEGVDGEFGWGMVNISAGIVSIEALETADGRALSSLRGSLPSEMSHLRGHLSEVSVALQITDNSYYNMPLSAVLPKAESSSQAARVAAEGLMTADYAAGESFRFWGGLDYDADGGSRFLSESGGVFGAAESSDTAGYVRWASADYDGFSLFGEYEYADINADYGGDSFIQSVRGARAEGWTAGMRFADIWKFGDSLRLSATDETALSGGKMILRYPVADGDGHAAFIGGTPQTIRMKETRIPLKRQRTMIYAIGYGREYESGKWSAAAAYNEHTNTTAFSIQLHTKF